ncbi:diguanylate cyclase [Rhodobacteraceae bacterium MCCB 386]|nr:diguanylate cyclase [Roseitranquillus sediminis]
MPMHLRVDSDLSVLHAGPTMLRIRPASRLIGRALSEIFEIRRPRSFNPSLFSESLGQKVHLSFRDPPQTSLKGVIVGLPDGGGIVNVSFGIGVVDAVRDYGLTSADFAATDLTIEMLYLVEAKSAAMEQSRDLNQRLQIAKSTAERQAQTDALTGAWNRRALEMELARVIETRTPFTLMRLDLDFFKNVNDTVGHAAGDHVLQVVTRILGDETRSGDIVARVGGDEFVLVLHGLVDAARADRIARRIIERVAEPIDFDGTLCQVGSSIGSTMSVLYDRPDLDRMQRDADAALYRSKHCGRGRHTSATILSGFSSGPASTHAPAA